MMNIKLLALIITSTILYSCKSDDKTPISTSIPIVVNPTITRSNIEDIAEEFHYVSLGAKKEFYIQNIDKLFFTDSLIMVADFGQKTFFIFDNEGTPMYKINKFGNGPGEYGQMADVLFDKKSKVFEVYSSMAKKIYTYDLKGTFLKETKITDSKYAGRRFGKSGNLYAFDRLNYPRDANRVGLFEAGSTLNFVKSYIPIPKAVEGIGYGSPLTFDNHNDSIYYLPTLLNDTIYSITKKGTTPLYNIQFPQSNTVPKNFLNDKKFKDYADYSSHVDGNWIDESAWLLVSDKFIYFNYTFRSMPVNAFYSKKTKAVLQFSELTSRDKPEMRVMNVVKAKKDNYFITTIHRTQYKNIPSKIHNTHKEENAVLLYYKLKPF